MTLWSSGGSNAIAHRAAVAALCCVLLAGCPRRDQIADQVEDGLDRIEQAETDPFSVDPALLTWTELAPIETGLDEPRGIALGPEGRIYLAGDTEVRVLNADGSLRGRFEVAGEPRAIAVGSWSRHDVAVFVALRSELLIYSERGAAVAKWEAPGERNYLTGVAVDGWDAYIADAGERVVIRHSPDLAVDTRYGEKDEARDIPGIVCPSPHLDVAVAPDGSLAITNPGRRRVEIYSPEGALLSSLGSATLAIEGFSGCCNPVNLAVLPDGGIVTAEKGMPRVKVCNRDGSIESVIALPEDLFGGAKNLDLAVDEAGRVMVLDQHKRTVRVFARTEAAEQ